MKANLMAVSLVLLAGCQSSLTNRPITAGDAQSTCVQLANEKADSMYHRRPFQSRRPARFEQGRWIWTDTQGAGSLDFAATVLLAANGSTNSVDVKMLDIGLHPRAFVPNR
jgi:hypothetical protein